MKNKLSILFIIMAMLFAVGCSNNKVSESNNNDNSKENNDASFPVTVELNGEQITIEKRPEKILPLSLEVTEIVLELVDPSKVVAATKGIDDKYLSTKSNIGDQIPNRIGAQVNIDTEEIISYDSDLLLLTKMFGQQKDAEKTLKQLNTPIVAFDTFLTVNQFMDAMVTIGEVVGEKEKATNIVEDMKVKIDSIQSSIPEGESPTVLILSEIGGDMGPFMIGPTNISYDLIKLAKAKPAVDNIGLERSTPASIEQVLKMDPDYIFLLDFFGKGEAGFDELMNKPGWGTLNAVKNEQIKIIDAKYLLNPNVENVKGLEMIVETIYSSN